MRNVACVSRLTLKHYNFGGAVYIIPAMAILSLLVAITLLIAISNLAVRACDSWPHEPTVIEYLYVQILNRLEPLV